MTSEQPPILPGIPSHGAGTASLRRQPVRIDDDGKSRSGYNDMMK
jgi:hypothetical protein